MRSITPKKVMIAIIGVVVLLTSSFVLLEVFNNEPSLEERIVAALQSHELEVVEQVEINLSGVPFRRYDFRVNGVTDQELKLLKSELESLMPAKDINSLDVQSGFYVGYKTQDSKTPTSVVVYPHDKSGDAWNYAKATVSVSIIQDLTPWQRLRHIWPF